ncbi:hemerythrin domain-containing protein [Actinoallomurus sp. NBC_01490]|uniref:hemerythrin domain-containing protein n=1 Tax=Actinoallomurus sp. NBC_01490 TaxID=2903557 RepID=UPI002E2FA736|nr:hemerythrin domain-containing protein [Actinoallomurus sp. NBC_01490]
MDSDDRSLISVLTRDHRRIANLLARLVRRDEDRRQLVDELTVEVMRHIAAEDLYLYPVAREVFPVAREAIVDCVIDFSHHKDIDVRVEQILADLAEAEPDSNSFDALVTKLVAEGSRVILHEELAVFPWLARYGDRQTLVELGDVIKSFEDAVVVEKACGAGFTIRFGDRVLHRLSPAAPGD